MNWKLGSRIRIAQETSLHATTDITTRLSRLDDNLQNKFIHHHTVQLSTGSYPTADPTLCRMAALEAPPQVLQQQLAAYGLCPNPNPLGSGAFSTVRLVRSEPPKGSCKYSGVLSGCIHRVDGIGDVRLIRTCPSLKKKEGKAKRNLR